MKKIIFAVAILLFTSALFAQGNDSISKFVFPRHEIKVSFGDAINTNQMWKSNCNLVTNCMGNLSISYSYRCLKWLWFGINAIHHIGKRYDIREYDAENNFSDYEYAIKCYGFGLIPEIRFSYLNRKRVTLYSGIAVGYSLMINNIDDTPYKMKGLLSYHTTIFAFSCYFGKNQKIFMGGELGEGHRGIFIIHGGYRF